MRAFTLTDSQIVQQAESAQETPQTFQSLFPAPPNAHEEVLIELKKQNKKKKCFRI